MLTLAGYAQEMGKVFVQSDPPGATVLSKGKMLGKTPLTLDLPIGQVVLTLKTDGYQTTQLLVQVPKDEIGREEVKLEKVGADPAEPEPKNTPPVVDRPTSAKLVPQPTPVSAAQAMPKVDDMDPGELFPTVSWENATSSVPMVETHAPVQPKVAPELVAEFKTVQERIATVQKTQAVEVEKRVEYKPISMPDDIVYYEKNYAEREKKAFALLRPEPVLDLVEEIRREADAAKDLPGRQRYLLLRSVIMVRKIKAPGSTKLQTQRADNAKVLNEQLTPLLSEESAAALLARTQLVACLSDILIERARFVEQQAKQAKFDAIRTNDAALKAVEAARISEQKANSALPGTLQARQLAIVAAQDKAQAEKKLKDAEEAKQAAEDAADDAEEPNAEAKKAMQRAYDEFVALAKWQLQHGYLDQAGQSVSEASRYANMLEEASKRHAVTELGNDVAHKLRTRDKYLRQWSGTAASQPASQPPSRNGSGKSASSN